MMQGYVNGNLKQPAGSVCKLVSIHQKERVGFQIGVDDDPYTFITSDDKFEQHSLR